VPAVSTFLGRHPELSVDLVLNDRGIDLFTERIDVALRMGTLEDSGAATARKIAESRRRVLGTTAYFDRAGLPATPSDLSAHEAIIYDQRAGGTEWSFKRGSSEEAVTLTGRMRITAAEGVLAAVLAGAGLTIASEWMFAPELKSGAVRSVLTDWTIPPISLWAVFPAGGIASAKAKAFITFRRSDPRHFTGLPLILTRLAAAQNKPLKRSSQCVLRAILSE